MQYQVLALAALVSVSSALDVGSFISTQTHVTAASSLISEVETRTSSVESRFSSATSSLATKNWSTVLDCEHWPDSGATLEWDGHASASWSAGAVPTNWCTSGSSTVAMSLKTTTSGTSTQIIGIVQTGSAGSVVLASATAATSASAGAGSNGTISATGTPTGSGTATSSGNAAVSGQTVNGALAAGVVGVAGLLALL